MELCHVVREVILYTVDRGTSAKGCKTSITAKQFRVEYYLNEKTLFSPHNYRNSDREQFCIHAD